MLIVDFNENEEFVYYQTLEYLVKKLSVVPTMARVSFDLDINPFTRKFVNKSGKEITLTSKEFDLLYFMYLHKGQVFSKEQLYENVWGYDDMPASSNLTSFIRKLRKKVEPDPDNPQYIITVWGVGYKFSEEKP
ncbi:winged helix-turn-helix domain-containing protein [Blautia pseudococcoides]|nr:winged helix-turn-helix domain-containing protein [Blautia pseudococcoides]